MWFTSWLRNSKRSDPGERLPTRASRRPRATFRPRLEALEDRWLPSQIGLTVTSLADSGPGTLRAAILTADAGSHSDKFTIDFAMNGTIDLHSPLPDLNNSIAIQGPGASSLVVVERAAGYSFTSAIVTVDLGQTVTLSGLTIANGNAGGIFNNGGTLTVANSAVVNNSFVGSGPYGLVAQGGGIFNFGGSLTVTASTISGNTASYGGGISSGGSFVSNASLTIGGSILSGNSAIGIDDPVTHNHVVGSGGGMFAVGAFTMTGSTISGNSTDGAGGGIEGGGVSSQAATISDSTFSANSAFWGGGIDAQGFMTISSSTLTGNTAQGGGGGMRIGGPTSVSGCAFSRNSATGATFSFGHVRGSGGAIYNNWYTNINSLTTTVRDSSFDHNSAEDGGAIFNPGALTVSGCILSGNSAMPGGGGGGLFNSPGGTVMISQSSLSGNSANDNTLPDGTVFRGVGGAIANIGGTITVAACTLSGNSAGIGGAIGNSIGVVITGGTYTYYAGTVTVRDSLLIGNSAIGGAAIYNGSTLLVSGSTFSNNTATLPYNSASFGDYGGGLFNVGIATLQDCSLSGNAAGNGGGGIFNSGALAIKNSKVLGNVAPVGADIYNVGVLILNDSTIGVIGP
jgi:hypothetical protein